MKSANICCKLVILNVLFKCCGLQDMTNMNINSWWVGDSYLRQWNVSSMLRVKCYCTWPTHKPMMKKCDYWKQPITQIYTVNELIKFYVYGWQSFVSPVKTQQCMCCDITHTYTPVHTPVLTSWYMLCIDMYMWYMYEQAVELPFLSQYDAHVPLE